MPSKQSHRGKHPSDDELFGERWRPVLRQATADLSWLLTRGYARKAATKIVGDHFQLALRQRTAVDRCACSDSDLAIRQAHEIPAEKLEGEPLAIDGYNLLITIESALAGGILVSGRDGCIRDMASLHGSYRRVEETAPAIRLIGASLDRIAPARVDWYLDAPVSNSGRLKTLIRQTAAAHGWPWEVHLIANPDRTLVELPHVAATADSWVLDRAMRWCNLSAAILAGEEAARRVLDLSVLVG